MTVIFTRREWTGTAEDLGELWTLTKGRRRARAFVVSHPLGVELRLEVEDELRQSQVYRDDDEPLMTQAEDWRQAMRAKGWT